MPLKKVFRFHRNERRILMEIPVVLDRHLHGHWLMSGSGSSQGRVVNGALVPTNYSASTTTSKKSEAIHMVLNNGTVKEYAIEPEPPFHFFTLGLEAMRREDYELQVSQPEVIVHEEDGLKMEPLEEVEIDVAEEF